MCFRATPEHTAKLRNRSQPMFFFKVVNLDRTRTTSLGWSGQHDHYTKDGVVQAYGNNGTLVRPRRNIIEKPTTMGAGIYVYKTIARAVKELNYYRKSYCQLIVVKCLPADVLGADANRACFAKVEVIS